MNTTKKINLIDELNKIEIQQVEIDTKLIAMDMVLDRTLSVDLSEEETTSEHFIYNLKNAVAEINIMQAAIQQLKVVSTENINNISLVIAELRKQEEMAACEVGNTSDA